MMDPKAIFFREKSACSGSQTHIMDGAEGAMLSDIDQLFGAADVLSVQNARRHRRLLFLLAVTGTLLTLTFLLYDEAELHNLIFACGAMILCLFLIHRVGGRSECHRKHLEYRVLAECLRVQFFLTYAGLPTRVSEIMPWSIRKGIPWVRKVLEEIPAGEAGERRSVLDPWIRQQRSYHEAALKKAEATSARDSRTSRIVLLITIAAYFAALLYELAVYRSLAGAHADLIRAVLKIILGTMSAAALFTGSYYGKMSLGNDIDDHGRMIDLYRTVEEEIARHGESEELLLFLAREFLNENSAWYAYQSKNTADIVM